MGDWGYKLQWGIWFVGGQKVRFYNKQLFASGIRFLQKPIWIDVLIKIKITY
jgi:hypothetical protein